AAQRREHVDELDAGDPGADDDEVLRQLAGRVGVAGGEDPRAVGRRPVGDAGPAAGGDEDGVGLDLAHALGGLDHDLVRPLQPPGAVDDADVLAPQQVDDVVLELGLDALDAVAQALEVELRGRHRQAHAGAGPHVAHGGGRGDHRLGGDAVPQVGRPADDVTLDHRDLGPQPGGGRGGGVAGGTATEDDEAEGHGPRVPAALAPTAVVGVAPARPGRGRPAGGQVSPRARRTRRWSGVNRCRVSPRPMMTTLVATAPRIRYMIAACTSTASTGSAPARMRPVMAPGRKTSPTALVFSICEVSAVRSADRTNGFDACCQGWPSARRASTSGRRSASSARMRREATTMLPIELPIIMPAIGTTARPTIG